MSIRHVRSFALLALPFALAAGQPILAAPQQSLRPDPPVIVSWAPQPRIQMLLDLPGALIVRESYRLGSRTTFGMTVAAIIVTGVLPEGPQLKGLRIDLGNNGKPGEDSGASVLDIEEAAALSRSLAAIIEMAAKGARDDRHVTEASFATLGGFVVDFRQDGRGQHAFMLAGRKESVRTAIEVTDLPTVKTLVDEALALLATK